MNRTTPAAATCLVALIAALSLAGCAEGGRPNADGGVTRCDVDDDCPLGQVCNRALETCESPSSPGPPSPGGDEGEGGPQGGDEQGAGEGEGEGEAGQPHVVETSPPMGTRGVSVGEAFRVTVKFSHAMNVTKVVAGIELWDDQGEFLPVVTQYDAATRTASVRPEGTLEAYGVYRVNVSGEISSADGAKLRGEEFHFSVGGNAVIEEAHLALASEYAPVVFQDTTPPTNRRVKRDYITAYDFDGAWNGPGKSAAATSAANKLQGGVYFSVVQTESHHFIHYIYYHPQDTDPLDGEVLRENSMKGAVVVVAKDSGAVRLVETWSPVGERFEPYAGPGTEFRLKDGIGERELVAMDEDWLTDGKRYHAYITEQRHDSCIWDHGRNDVRLGPFCRHDARKFQENSGIQYTLEPGGRAGEEPNWVRHDDCADECFRDGRMCRDGACHDTTYQLHNFTKTIWVRRSQFGDESLWANAEKFNYDAPAARVGLGTGFSLPSKLIGDDGKEPDSGKPPWAWEDTETRDRHRGSWFLDPAWTLAQRVDMPGEGWSDKYCWNPYLGIDNMSAPECS